MMLPILISVSVAPMSYFFWARDVPLVAASIARAAEKAPNRKWIAGILISLDHDGMCHVCWIWSALRPLATLNTFRSFPATESPPRQRRGGLVPGRPVGP